MEWEVRLIGSVRRIVYALMLDFTTGICKLQLNLRFKHQCRELIF
jgi:hypothetical protein